MQYLENILFYDKELRVSLRKAIPTTIPVVKAPLSCFFVAIELVEVVVEIQCTRAQESSEQRGVCSKHCGNVQLPNPGHDESDSGHPLVEMGHDPGLGVRIVLRQVAEVTQEFGTHESEED